MRGGPRHGHEQRDTDGDRHDHGHRDGDGHRYRDGHEHGPSSRGRRRSVRRERASRRSRVLRELLHRGRARRDLRFRRRCLHSSRRSLAVLHGSGSAYELTYDVSLEGPGSFQLNMHPTSNSGFGGGFSYSPCPTEFVITNGSAALGSSTTLVPFY